MIRLTGIKRHLATLRSENIPKKAAGLQAKLQDCVALVIWRGWDRLRGSRSGEAILFHADHTSGLLVRMKTFAKASPSIEVRLSVFAKRNVTIARHRRAAR